MRTWFVVNVSTGTPPPSTTHSVAPSSGFTIKSTVVPPSSVTTKIVSSTTSSISSHTSSSGTKSTRVSSFSTPSTIPSGKSWHAQMLNPSVTIIVLDCSCVSLFIEECYRESFEQCGNITFLVNGSTIDRRCTPFIIDCDSAILFDSNRYVWDASRFTNY